MAKVKVNSKIRNKEIKSGFDISKIIPNNYQTIAAVGFIILLVSLFFSQLYFGGKTVVSGDILNMQSYKTLFEKSDVFLWDPYVFLGMPAFGNISWYDLSGHIIQMFERGFSGLFQSYYTGWTFYFILLGLFFFLLMRYLKTSLVVSLFVAAAAMFSTGILLLFNIGHITKLLSLVSFPLVILFLLKFKEKIRLLDTLLFLLTIHFLLKQWHVQIMFYIFFTVGIFYLFFFIRSFVKKDKALTIQLAKSAGIFVFITIAALAMNYHKLLQIYEYTPYSTRGTKSITDLETKAVQQSDEEFYQYATNWSFSPGEMMTFFFPSYYGYGGSTYNGPLSNNQPVEVNTYFGQMPFVDTAQYMGVVVVALALFAMFVCRKEPLVQFLITLIAASLLLSFGRTFPILYDFFFYNFPFFNKFRAPSMILNLVQLSLPILAGIGLMKILTIKQEREKSKEKLIRIIALSVSALFVISLLFNQSISDWFTSRVAETGQKGEQLKPLYDYMSSMFLSDVFYSLALTAGVFWFILLYLKEKISFDALGIIAVIIIIIDLWRIDYRGVNFIDPAEIEQRYVMPDYVSTIKNQKNSGPYRLLNLKQDGSPGSFNQNNNFHVYFLEEDFYGYSGIKPRSYQDIIDVVGPVNETLWRMLNVKYIITDQQVSMDGFKLIQSSEKSFLYEYEKTLPRAYFVDSIAESKPIEFLNAVKSKSFDPKRVAFIEPGREQINISPAGENSYASFKRYEEEIIQLEVNAVSAEGKTGENHLLFLGSTFYPIGWKARMDGNQVEIHKINHGFMGVVVPNGKHTIEFVYEPASFYTGRIITLILNVLILGGLGLVLIPRLQKTK